MRDDEEMWLEKHGFAYIRYAPRRAATNQAATAASGGKETKTEKVFIEFNHRYAPNIFTYYLLIGC